MPTSKSALAVSEFSTEYVPRRMAVGDDVQTIDRGLLRRLDWAQPYDGLSAPAHREETSLAPHARFDISTVLEAVRLTATSMTTMAERIRELEAHTTAFSAANKELEIANRQITSEIDEVLREHGALAVNLKAEQERSGLLEGQTAHHVARATTIERNLNSTRADLTTVVESIKQHFASGAEPATI